MENKTTAAILSIRRNIQILFQKYSRGIRLLLKYIASFLLFMAMNDLYDKTGRTYLIMAVVLAAICAGIPFRHIYLVSIFLTTLYLCQVSWDLVVFYLAAVILSYLMVGRIEEHAGMIIAFAPLFFYMKIPLLLPILVGMFSNMFGVGAMLFGIAFYYFGTYVKDVMILLSSVTGGEDIIAVRNVIEAFSKDPKCLLIMTAAVITAVLVYLFYHQSFDYAWFIAILAGGISGLVVFLAGSIFFDISSKNWGYIAGLLVSMLIAALVQFFRCIIDYGSVEYIEFEDDEYYYYVKAVPKVTTIGEDFSPTVIGTEDKTVRHFNNEEK